MQLSEQAIVEFQKMYEKEYGLSLNREQAMECGTKLIDLVKVVFDDLIPKSLDAIKQRGYDNHGHS